MNTGRKDGMSYNFVTFIDFVFCLLYDESECNAIKFRRRAARGLPFIGGAFLESLKKFLRSAPFAVLQLLLACMFVFTGQEVAGTMIFSGVIAATLAVTGDVMTGLPGLMLTVCFAIRCKHAFGKFLHHWYLAVPTFVFFAIYLIAHRHPLSKGRYFLGLLPVSVAVTLGGLGIITPSEYFSATPIFYTILLGFGMLFLYLFLHGALTARPKEDHEALLTRAMLCTIFFLCICLVQEYCYRRNELQGGFEILPFQWRNNASTLLMLAMPFPFYLACRRYGWFYVGLLVYLAILFTGSRGGMIFGAGELLLCIVVSAVIDRRHRLPTLITLVVILLLVFLIRRYLLETFRYTLERLLDPHENAARLQLLPRGLADFKANPLFGRGLGYLGNRDVHRNAKYTLCWYHCSPVQVLGSFGLVGAAAYGWMLLVRLRVLAKHLTLFNLTLFLSYLGLELMSFVNPGIFAPFPYLFLVTLYFALMEARTTDADRAGFLAVLKKEETA